MGWKLARIDVSGSDGPSWLLYEDKAFHRPVAVLSTANMEDLNLQWKAQSKPSDDVNLGLMEIFRIIQESPETLRVSITDYMRLFVSGKERPTWPRLIELFRELQALLQRGVIRMHGKMRRAPIEVWQSAFDFVIASKPFRLSNHELLKAVCWDMAKPLKASEG